MGSSPGIWLKLRIENFSTISRGLKPFSFSACNVLRISHTRQLQGKDMCKFPYATLVAPGCTLSDYNSTPGISKTSPNLMQQKGGNLLFRCTLRATETLYMANDEALTGVSLEMHRLTGGFSYLLWLIFTTCTPMLLNVFILPHSAFSYGQIQSDPIGGRVSQPGDKCLHQLSHLTGPRFPFYITSTTGVPHKGEHMQWLMVPFCHNLLS